VLCPRGTLRWDSPAAADERRYYYRGAAALEREVLAALAALQARFPGRVRDGAVVYAGFSQGAILGLPILQRHGRRFRRALLVEGGHRWSAGSARAYRAAGAERVLLACGQGGCVSRAAWVAGLLREAGVEVRTVQAVGAGHTYDGPVADVLRPALPWLLEGL
jgi:predicted esterase